METTLKEQLQSATSPQKPGCYHCRELTSFLGLMLMDIVSAWIFQHGQEFILLRDAIVGV